MTTGQQPETVRAYLAALQAALKGAPPALIRDALTDAEEHLRNEIIQHPAQTEREVLLTVVETYGAPDEVADTYRTMEAAWSGPFPKSEARGARRGFFSVVSDPRSYGGLVYMLLSLATGTFYFVWTLVGIVLSLVLFPLIIGVPFALLFIGSERVISHVEGRIVETLLGVRMPRRLLPPPVESRSILSRIGGALSDGRTWSSMFYLLLMLPLGVVYFVIAVVGVSVSLGSTAMALYALLTNQSHIQLSGLPFLEHLLHTAPGLIVLALLGIVLFACVLHLAKLVGFLHGKLAEVLLVRL
ncbi:MAG TPA: sensor domain-containing protein [Rhizomicrobium sp.]|nr:sensor domain-containing protein [Rhizomicrobium sp.]